MRRSSNTIISYHRSAAFQLVSRSATSLYFQMSFEPPLAGPVDDGGIIRTVESPIQPISLPSVASVA